MPVGEWAGETQGSCFELCSDPGCREKDKRAECGSVNVLGGAREDSWVESAGSVWMRSVGPAGLCLLALGLIQTILSIVPRNGLWDSCPLNH